MAAFLYTYNGRDIFNSNVRYSSPVATAFDDMERELGLLTSVSASINESIQYFLTFDDIISYLHLGKGVGQINIEGIALPNCNYDMPALKKFFSIVSRNRGKEMTVSFAGGGTFSGPLVSASCAVVGGDVTVANFAAQIAVTSHSLGSRVPTPGGC